MLCWFLHQHTSTLNPAEQDTVFSLTKVVYSNRKEGEEKATCISHIKPCPGLQQVVLTFSPVFITVKTPVVLSSHPQPTKNVYSLVRT